MPLILAFSSFAAFGGPSHQSRVGILGGPSVVSAEEPDYSVDNPTLFESLPSPEHLGINQPATGGINEGIMETAVLSGGESDIGVKPTSRKPQSLPERNADSGPDLKGYFTMPTVGFDWGILHFHNAVDIANACGTKIAAAADGLVDDVSLDPWSGGYGHYVLISHSNGTKTRYAHLQKISVSVGQFVKKRDLIGTMGTTGDSTGCHLHFEVLGAINPFAK